MGHAGGKCQGLVWPQFRRLFRRSPDPVHRVRRRHFTGERRFRFQSHSRRGFLSSGQQSVRRRTESPVQQPGRVQPAGQPAGFRGIPLFPAKRFPVGSAGNRRLAEDPQHRVRERHLRPDPGWQTPDRCADERPEPLSEFPHRDQRAQRPAWRCRRQPGLVARAGELGIALHRGNPRHR